MQEKEKRRNKEDVGRDRSMSHEGELKGGKAEGVKWLQD